MGKLMKSLINVVLLSRPGSRKFLYPQTQDTRIQIMYDELWLKFFGRLMSRNSTRI
jgi:hypothetical protein